MRRSSVIVVGCWALLAGVPVSRAGLYQKDVLVAFDLDENGYAIPFSLSSFSTFINMAGGADFVPFFPETDLHKELIRAIAERRKKGYGNLSPAEVVAQSADLLRLRREGKEIDEAVNLLQLYKSRPPAGFEFLILTHLAHGHLLRNEYSEAFTAEESAVKDYDFPQALPGLSEKQVKWYHRLERDYYLGFLRNRNEENRHKVKSHDLLDPLFPSSAKGPVEPVRYVGPSGTYEAGTIADSEKAKLPPDAIAIVQQLILWNPDDNRLLWQLGELYNATGDLKSAWSVFEMLLDFNGRKYTNPELREHHGIVLAAYKTQLEIEARMQETRKRVEEGAKRQLAEEYWRLLYVLTGVAVFVGFWQIREFLRRWQNSRPR